MFDDAASPLPNLSVQQLEYLLAATNNPTRAAAAEQLGVTPSALTQGLTELERRVGLPLFERRGKFTVLRPQAEQVLDYARRVIAETNDLKNWTQTELAGTSGQIRLGAVDAVAVNHRANEIREFHKNFPEVDLRLTVAPSGQLLEALFDGSLDIVACVEPEMIPEGLSSEVFLEEPLFIYAPKEKVVKDPKNWGPWVSFPKGSHTREVIASSLATLGASYEVTAESNQPEVLAEMVRLGLGWAVLPSAQARIGIENLAPIKKTPLAVRRLVLVRRSSSPLDSATQTLLKYLKKIET
ncbi:MAG: Hydrogen peroxide-inducible genes activator [Acidimicrobiales bacterium AG-410-I20]|nr:MAG: Hydrogen peroxide-inducible genes activator [Acidimicrobiales bacterium AG-410-I20]